MIATASLRRARRWPCLALLAALVVMLPSMVWAHAGLTGSEPVNDAVLPVAPPTLTLSFNEAVEPLVMQIIDRNGSVAITRIERRGANLVLTPPVTLTAGSHILSWRVRSEDGHPVGGSLTFWIGARDTARPDIAGTTSASLVAAIWVARLVIYIGLFVGVGGAFFLAWMTASSQPGAGCRRAIAAAMGAGWAGLACSIGLQGLDALAAPWSALIRSSTWITGAQGSFGVAAALAAMAILLGMLSLRAVMGARNASLGGMIAVGLALAATGHAANADPRLLAVVLVFLHGVSLTFWIGALLPLADALRASGNAGVVTLQRFSRTIPVAIIALFASGVTIAALQLQRVDALWSTEYGQVLLAKLVLVAALLAIALWNRVALTPQVAAGSPQPLRRLRRSIAIELLLVAVILGVVGLWRFTPPPRLLAPRDDSFFTHIHTDKAMANVTISPGQAGPVDIVVQLETPDERPLAVKALTISLANPALGIEPLQVGAQLAKDGNWHARMTAPVAGRWSLGLGILISDFDKLNVEAPILLK